MFIISHIFFILFYIKLDSVLSAQSEIYTFKYYEIVENRLATGLVKFNSTLIRSTFFISEDISKLSRAAIVFIYRDSKVQRLNIRQAQTSSLYVGNTGHSDVSIMGYIDQEIFVGKINFYDKIFYVERAATHSVGKRYRNLGILYNLRDVNLNSAFKDGKPICENMESESFLNITSPIRYHKQLHPQPLNIKIPFRGDSYRIKRSVCSLEFLIDHTFFEHMDSNRGRVVSDILYYAKIIDEVFRNTDVNGDGTTEDIEFSVEKITIFEQRNQPGYPFKVETNDSDKFLKSLTEYSHNYCLLICFCHRDFWTENRCAISKVTKIGAICSNDTKELFSTGKRNHNVMFVTSLERSLTIPRFRITSNLLHQLGHAFNCRDDPEENRFCRPGDSDKGQGNYIMHPNIPYGMHENNWKFSSCCRKFMREFIKLPEIENCLLTAEKAICGNGIVEEGESCDCDESTDDCEQVNKCCFPKGTYQQCTLRATKSCSPGKGNCCDDNCNIVTNTQKKCFSNLPCLNKTSYCDGFSSFCPGEKEPDGTVCMNNYGTCIDNECKSDICKDNNLQLCQCSLLITECHICCKNVTGECLPSKDFGLLPSLGEFYVKQPGSNCDNAYGTCTSNGSCIRKPIFRMYTIWHYLAPLPFVMFIAASIACFYTQQEKRITVMEREGMLYLKTIRKPPKKKIRPK